MRVHPDWLVEPCEDKYVCNICTNLIDQFCVGCPEGHPYCRSCYVEALLPPREPCCPMCNHPTSLERLCRVRTFDDVVPNLQTRCMHGNHHVISSAEEDSAAGEFEASSSSSQVVASPHLPAKRLRSGAPVAPQRVIEFCAWVGRVDDLSNHLRVDCEHYAHDCIFKKDGCTMSLKRSEMIDHLLGGGDVIMCEYQAVGWAKSADVAAETEKILVPTTTQRLHPPHKNKSFSLSPPRIG